MPTSLWVSASHTFSFYVEPKAPMYFYHTHRILHTEIRSPMLSEVVLDPTRACGLKQKIDTNAEVWSWVRLQILDVSRRPSGASIFGI
eukprot:3697707-Amphidinium_carterae.1